MITEPKIKVVLFDFFGVLSTPAYKQAIDHYFPDAERREWMRKLDPLDLGELSEEDLIREIAQAAGVGEQEVRNFAFEAPALNAPLIEFIAKYLKPVMRVGIFTNIQRPILERIMGKTLDLFDIQLVSSDLKLLKPSKEIFEVAIKRCGVSSNEILFIDDLELNVAAAHESGMQSFKYEDLSSCVAGIRSRI